MSAAASRAEPRVSVLIPGFGGMRAAALRQGERVRELLGDFAETVVADGANVSDARNRALDAATGEWIAWVDADDEVGEPWADLVRRIVREDAADVAIIGCDKVSPDGSRGAVAWDAAPGPVAPDFALAELLRDNLPAFPVTKVTRRRLWEGLRFDSRLARMEDYMLFPRLFARAGSFRHYPESVYGYVQRAGSLTREGTLAAEEEVLAIARRRAEEWRGTRFGSAARTGWVRDVFGLVEFGWLNPRLGYRPPPRRELLALLPSALAARVPWRYRVKWVFIAIGFELPQRLAWRLHGVAPGRGDGEHV